MSKRFIKNSNKEQGQWFLIHSEDSLKQDADGNNRPIFCKLKHPKSGVGAQYLFSHGDKKVEEILAFQEEHRSWFIGQTVQQDGSLYMTTPIDPVFLVLPYLISASKNNKFMTLDQIVEDESFPECHRLCTCVDSDQLKQVAECKGPDDLKAYKYSKDRTISWLTSKVNRIADKIEEKQIHVTGGAVLESFIKSAKSTASRDEYIRFAYGILTDYLPLDLAKDLKDHLGIKAPVHDKPEIEEPPAKRAKTDDSGPTDDYSLNNNTSKADDKKKLSISQNKLSKVDKSGMKSISSFFTKKSSVKK